nr:hypothetical protein [uncultured Methanomethylovorans sp.]
MKPQRTQRSQRVVERDMDHSSQENCILRVLCELCGEKIWCNEKHKYENTTTKNTI